MKYEMNGSSYILSVSQLRQFSRSVSLTLCDPMDCSAPGLPVHHQIPEFSQTHVRWVSDAIQLSLSSPSPPAFNLSQHQCLFKWVSNQLQHQSFQMNTQYWFPLRLTRWISLPCPRDSQESSPTPQFKSINSSVLSFLYSATLTSIHDHWKNHSFD